MPAEFVVVPEWQASPSARAMRLAEGAEIIAGDLPARSMTRVDVPASAGESQGSGIARLTSLRTIAGLIRDALAATPAESPVIGIGGDRGIAPVFLSHSATRVAGPVALVAFDAEPCEEEPSKSGTPLAFEKIAYRATLGKSDTELDASSPAVEGVAAGVRAAPGAAEHLLAFAETPDALRDTVGRMRIEACHIHVDMSVLDPSEMSGLLDASPFGWSVADLTRAIADVAEALPVAGASLSGFAPASPDLAADDLSAILRVIGALTRAVTSQDASGA